MGKLSDFKQNLKTNTQSETVTENIPVRFIEFIDNNTGIKGIRLDTKEEVTVYLRDISTKDQPAQQGAKKRPEFVDFVKGKYKAEPNRTVFVIESSYKDKNDPSKYFGRWIKLASKNPEEAKVVIVYSSLAFIKRENAETIFTKTVFPKTMVEVTSEDELKHALLTCLTPKAPGSNPFAVIKLTDNNTKEVETVEVYSARVEREDDIPGKKTADALYSYENFMTKSPQSQMIKEFISDPDITIEVMTGAILYPGSMTKEQMLKSHVNSKKILQSAFYVNRPTSTEEGSSEDVAHEIGYVKCILATRVHADETPYFTFIKPIVNFPTSISIKDIKKDTV